MFGLIGYALLSLITALILSPVIKFGKDFSSYLCVFGFVYLTLFFIRISGNIIPKEINPNNYLPFNIPGVEILVALIFITLIISSL